MTLKQWFLFDMQGLPPGHAGETADEHAGEPKHPWYSVMCLTGVDYFSTLGYQPGIAFLAAGALSPIATLVLVLVTLFAALPVYMRVAEASPNGQGSIAMLQNLLPGWSGKVFVLVLLGFATTDFVITMTLSAADAAAHFVGNPFVPHWMHSQMAVTLILLTILGAIFLKGFKEAIHIAVVLTVLYLVLNGIVTVVAMREVMHHPTLVPQWRNLLYARHSHVIGMVGVAVLLFPRLALGLSGFETGVAVMPLIQGDTVAKRIRNTRALLATAALIMSTFLIATSIVTTLLIPAAAFRENGPANGRAMAYLAHQYLGNGFGAAYDVSTILILAFAGASAMAGLLNLIPRYLPKFGMAPEWIRASRPLVAVFLGVAFMVTLLFRADVDAQGGAYATGVLVLMTSGSCAVTLSTQGRVAKVLYGLVSVVFIYTTLVNIWERPEGLKIACFFIAVMILVSLVSRAARATELRISGVELDEEAQRLLAEDEDQIIRLIARNPRKFTERNRDDADVEVRRLHALSPEAQIYFFEVERSDASDFSERLFVYGRREGRHRILFAKSPVVANAIAGMLLDLERRTGKLPHAYFHWTEVSPFVNVLRFIFLGEGDTAPLTHEVLRRAVKKRSKLPVIHVA